jgi:hypothetical protein
LFDGRRLRGRVSSETQVDIRAAEVQTKLLFKYSGSMAEYRYVGIPEYCGELHKSKLELSISIVGELLLPISIKL